MKYRFVPVLAFVIFGCNFLGMQCQAGIQGKMSKEHFQKREQLQSQINDKDKHAFIYESLKDKYKGYTTDVMKTLAFLLICLGWFITSDKSRDFFKKNRIARVSSIITLVIIGIIHIRSQILSFKSSQYIISEISSLNYFDPKYYENYEINIGQLITNSIQNVVLFAVLILIIFSLKEVKNK